MVRVLMVCNKKQYEEYRRHFFTGEFDLYETEFNCGEVIDKYKSKLIVATKDTITISNYMDIKNGADIYIEKYKPRLFNKILKLIDNN